MQARTVRREILWSAELIKTGKYSSFLIDKGIKEVNYHRCEKCRWIISFPLMKKGIFKKLYEEEIPVHPHGKKNYEAIQSNEDNMTIKRNKEIYKALNEKFSFNTYAEIGCPYQGLLMIIERYNQSRHKRINLTYINNDEIEFWGSNCKFNGIMCKDVLTRTIDKIEVVQIEKIKQRYDVIGIFNYIDHSQNPLELIEKAKKVTDRILLVTHSPNKSGPQHRYILDKDTITCLFQDYGSVRFLQLEKEFKDYIIAIAEKTS